MSDHDSEESGRNVRSRIIETLELMADEAAQRKYQAAVPYIDVPSEMFNQWDDWYDRDRDGASHRPFMSSAEFEAVHTFAHVIAEVGAATPRYLPPLDEFIRTEAWRTLSTAARVALRAFGKEPA